MQITRLYTGPDGESHFEDVAVPFGEEGVAGRLSPAIEATGRRW